MKKICADLKPLIYFTKMTTPCNCQPYQCNPVLLCITTSTLTNSRPALSHFYGMGIDINGKDSLGIFKICIIPPSSPSSVASVLDPTPGAPMSNKTRVSIVKIIDLRETLAIKTKYQDANALLEWIKYSVHTLNKSNYYTCMHSRPEAQIIPFPLRWSPRQPDMDCMVGLFQNPTAWDNPYAEFSLQFPEIQHPVGQPLRAIQFPPLNAKFTSCISWQGENLVFLGSIKGCKELKPFQELAHPSMLSHPQANVWWYCGGPLLDTLPNNWRSTWALIQLAIPFTLAFHQSKKVKTKHCRPKETPYKSFNPQVYMNAIKVL
ncbi:uncharacterized protein LOC134761547 [Pongo abelii]|uniref:uncharacterized protein LOC134761547 n=1 Tax=Pongo abelii TaxID=9601 RepID=UPI003005EE8F